MFYLITFFFQIVSLGMEFFFLFLNMLNRVSSRYNFFFAVCLAVFLGLVPFGWYEIRSHLRPPELLGLELCLTLGHTKLSRYFHAENRSIIDNYE